MEVSGRSLLILGVELSAFRLEPRTFLYDWLYVGALAGRPGLIDEVESYTAFTDIEFSPKRSINCRARSVSLFQELRVAGAGPVHRARRARMRAIAPVSDPGEAGTVPDHGRGVVFHGGEH